MRRLARWLLRTPTRRAVLLALLLALAWTAWAFWPPAPDEAWSLAGGEVGSAQVTPDGLTVVTGRLPPNDDGIGFQAIQEGRPLVGRDLATGAERYRLDDS